MSLLDFTYKNLSLVLCRWVWIVAAGTGQEDIRAGRSEHAGQRAGELQGAWRRVDDRIPPRD